MIYLLNFLIAIVSDSYSNVIENQAQAVLLGRLDLNGEHLKSLWRMPEKDIELLMLATCIEQSDSNAWEGISKSIKRKINESNKMIDQKFKNLARLIRGQVGWQKAAGAIGSQSPSNSFVAAG